MKIPVKLIELIDFNIIMNSVRWTRYLSLHINKYLIWAFLGKWKERIKENETIVENLNN